MLAAIGNHLWQSTFFAIGVAIVAALLRRDGAHVRYWLWWAASVKFLVPFAWLTAAGGLLAASAPRALVPEWPASLERFAEPIAPEGVWSPLVVGLLTVWAAGFVAVAALWTIRALRVLAVAADATPCMDVDVTPAALPVKRSRARIEPAVVGIARPVLLLPEGIERKLTCAQLAAVVEHELCHWRRRDNLTTAVHMLVAAVFWFYPPVWWIGRQLLAERERACDEAVVAAGHDRAVYAEAVLDVCALYVASPLECAAGVGGADLKQRITTIVVGAARTRLHAAKKVVLAAGGFSALVAPFVIGLLSVGPVAAQDDRDVIPLVRIAPVYPPEALAGGLEGSVQLRFTVKSDGTTTDLEVVDSTSSWFEQPAIDAVMKWRYAPRAAERVGVHTVIRFQLERDDVARAPAGAADTAAAAFNVGDQELLNLYLGAYLPQEMPLQTIAAVALQLRAAPIE